MSTIDRIRESVRNEEPNMTLSVDELKALCDLYTATESFLHDDQQPGEATRERMAVALDRFNGQVMAEAPVLEAEINRACGCIDDVWSDGSRERAVNCESHMPARRVAELEQAIRDHRDAFDDPYVEGDEHELRLWAAIDAEP